MQNETVTPENDCWAIYMTIIGVPCFKKEQKIAGLFYEKSVNKKVSTDASKNLETFGTTKNLVLDGTDIILD